MMNYDSSLLQLQQKVALKKLADMEGSADEQISALKAKIETLLVNA